MANTPRLVTRNPQDAICWQEKEFRAELAEACRLIDELPELDGATRDSERRVLPKLDALDEALGRFRRPLTGVRPHVDHIAYAFELIGHRKAKRTATVRAAIDKMEAQHRDPTIRPRHNPERPIDLALDRYEALVLERGYGTPRPHGGQERIDMPTTAEEVGRPLAEFTSIAIARLKQINSVADRPGPVVGGGGGDPGPTSAPVEWHEQDFRNEVDAACRRIDRDAELKDLPHNAERRLLRKLEALDGLLSHHKRPLSGARTYVRPVPYALELIRHSGAPATARVRDAVAALLAKHPGASRKLRHNPERPIDLKLDDYEARVLERGYGTPRAHGSLSRIDKPATAEDVGCALADLTGIAMQRLTHINTLVDRPGPLKGIEENAMHHLVNPVAGALLRKGLARYKKGLPENPLRPGSIDLITVAIDCGVGMKDLRFSRENQRIVEDARGDSPLVPHPCIAKRRYTFRQLLATGERLRRAELGDRASASALLNRTLRSLRDLMALPGIQATERDAVPRDFEARVRRAVAAGPSRFGSHWKRDMERWREYDRKHRETLPLPDDIALALRVLIAETGLPTSKVAAATEIKVDNLQPWITGFSTPSHGQQDAIERLAGFLGTTAERLTASVSAEWRVRSMSIDHPDFVPEIARYLPKGFEELEFDAQTKLIAKIKRTHLTQDTASARRGAALVKDPYRLKFDKWPQSMKDAWKAQYPEPGDPSKNWTMRVPGEDVVDHDIDEDLSAADRPLRPATVGLHLLIMESMLGYFIRPRVLTELQRQQAAMLNESMTTDFRPRSGLGIPMELIHPAILAIPDLVSSFVWWRSHRSGMQTRLTLTMLNVASKFVRPKSGVVWHQDSFPVLKRFKEWWDNNPHDLSEGRLKLDIAPFDKNWQKAVKKTFRTHARDHKKVRKGKLPSSRDPFLPINAVLKEDAPMEAYMAGVHTMLASRPAKVINRHVHLRDAILTLVLLQTGLRAGTLLFQLDPEEEDAPALSAHEEQQRQNSEMRIWKETGKDGAVAWRIRIAADRFKNYFSSFFQGGKPYEYTLKDEEDLYAKIDRYLDFARPYMLKDRATNAFFVTQFGTDVDAAEIRDIYHRITRYYFVERPTLPKAGEPAEAARDRMGIPGMMIHGPHAVRHIIATQVVKSTGSLHMAAWAIQDTYQTAAKHYARFYPNDKSAMAAKALEDARAAARATAEARRAAAEERALAA